METTRYEMLLKARTPIAHASETIGNQSLFNRKPVRQPNDDVALVGYLSGDSIRHQMREAAAYGTLHAAGILDDPQLSEGALRLLWSGGMVTGKGDASVINIERYRELVSLFPPLALFGGCTDNRPLPGQLNVDEGDLVCTEQAHNFPAWLTEWLAEHGERVDSCRAYVEETQRVRMDPTLFPDKVKLLSDHAQANVSGRALMSEAAHESGDAVEKQKSKSTMMPRTHERLIQGSLLWFGVEARTYSPLERDAFEFTLACLLNNFKIGGKQATGHGKLEFVAGARVHFEPTAGKLESIGADLAPRTGEIYRAHVAQRKEELISWLRGSVNS